MTTGDGRNSGKLHIIIAPNSSLQIKTCSSLQSLKSFEARQNIFPIRNIVTTSVVFRFQFELF